MVVIRAFLYLLPLTGGPGPIPQYGMGPLPAFYTGLS